MHSKDRVNESVVHALSKTEKIKKKYKGTQNKRNIVS